MRRGTDGNRSPRPPAASIVDFPGHSRASDVVIRDIPVLEKQAEVHLGGLELFQDESASLSETTGALPAAPERVVRALARRTCQRSRLSRGPLALQP